MMSYNTVLAEYITEYLKSEREEVTLENFKKFMHKQINKIPSSSRSYYKKPRKYFNSRRIIKL